MPVLDVLPITMEIPDHPEPLAIVRDWAHSLRVGGGKAGEHYAMPSDLHGILAVRIQVPRAQAQYLRALYTLTRVNVWCLRAALTRRLSHGPFAPLYSAICYQREPAGQEIWQCTEALYQRKIGDCEDLACALAAEKILMGTPARPALKAQPRPNGTVLYHVVVRTPDGIEDPSAKLGMRLGRPGNNETSPRCARVLRDLETRDRFATKV